MLLIVSVAAIMFLLGMFFGAGLYGAGVNALKEKNDLAIKELALSRMEIDGLIEATGQLATLNYHILEAQAYDKERLQLLALGGKFQGRPS
jgi:hypothetical protein